MKKTSTVSTESTPSSELTHRQKYHGLIKRSKFKDFRDSLFQYFDYIYTMAPSFYFACDVFRVIIFIQQVIISFYPFDQVLWPNSKILGRIFSVISVIAFISPVSVNSITHFGISIIIYIFLIIFYIIFFSNLYMFSKMSKVSFFVINLVTFYCNILQQYLINLVSSNIGRDINFIIEKDNADLHIITLVIGILLLVNLVFFQTLFVTPSIAFRPQTTFIMFSNYSFAYCLCNIFIFLFITLGSIRTDLTGTIISYMTVIPVMTFTLISIKQHIFGELKSMVNSVVVSITLFDATIILPTLSYKKIEGNEIIIIAFLAFTLIVLYSYNKFIHKKIKRSLHLLTEVEENENLFNELSYTQIINLLRYGFENGHQLCHSWKLFDLALEKFHNDHHILLMYVRYSAIYAEEINTFKMIHAKLKAEKHGSLEMKHILFEVESMLQHRERGLSNSLKRELKRIQEKTVKCVGMLRYTWECVIRGNVVELEELSSQLKKIEEEIHREYNQLFLEYPNNPHVASNFSSFLLHIMNDEKEASEKKKLAVLLRTGSFKRTEKSYYFAVRHFPNLPSESAHASMTKPKVTMVNDTHSIVSSVSTVGAMNELMDENETKIQQKYIETMINSVLLPTSRYGPIIIFIAVCILIAFILIVEFAAVNSKMKENWDSLSVIETSSYINIFMSHLPFLCFQYVMSSKNYTSSLQRKWNDTYLSDNLDGVFKNKVPLFQMDDKKAIFSAVELLRIIVNFFNSRIPNFVAKGYFKDSLYFIMGPHLMYKHYRDVNTCYYSNESLEKVITYTQASSIYIATNMNLSAVMESADFWSVVKNAPLFYSQYTQFEDFLSSSFQKHFDETNKDILIIVLCSLIPGIVVSLALIIFLIYKMEKEKSQIYKSFLSIPKSEISSIVQQLNERMDQKEGDEKNDNKETKNIQEENALRMLSTSVDQGLGWFGRSWKIVLDLVIFYIAAIIAVVFMCIIPCNSNDNLIQLAPLYHEASSVHVQMMITLLLLCRNGQNYTDYEKDGEMIYDRFPCEEYPDEFHILVQYEELVLKSVTEDAHKLRFGSVEKRSRGISGAGESLTQILTGKKQVDIGVPEEDIAILEMCNYDTALEFVDRVLSSMVIKLKGNVGYYSMSNDKISMTTVWLLDTSYMQYVRATFDKLDEVSIERSKKYRVYQLLIPLIALIVIMVLCGIILVPFFEKINNNTTWVLRLLMFCNPSVVLQSKDILKVLSNDFSPNDEEQANKHDFYELVVSNLIDGVVFMSNDLIIRSANDSVYTITGKDPHKILGTSISELFVPPPGEEASLRSFYQAIDGVMGCLRPPTIEMEVTVLKDGESISLLLSMNAISSDGEVVKKPVNSDSLAILILSIKDITSTVASRSLLKEENEKNEKLLSMILPPVIVNQLQKGEQSICFSVQSASIVFMDIVSFTPWCGSNKAAYIMSTLNKLFLYFDNALKKLDKMTKIKCIGDCYMCAGGIFDEVNQPALHAKQAITFGLEAIKCVERIDVELNEKLRIRVGCNTGGPIVAGVLGIEKPTFDILGPDINLGAMMEHHGVPMHVHIPQHVYDLVNDGFFVIKERGDVDVKGKMYHTYVVSGYGNPIH